MNKALEAHTIIATTAMYSPLFARARADPGCQALAASLAAMRSWVKRGS